MTSGADALEDALRSRKSVRGFLATPIDKDALERLFALAQRAPSWCNTQPWRVVVTGPDATREATLAMLEAAKSAYPKPDVPFPLEYPEPYKQHRRQCGYALYSAMGVARDDKPARYAAWLRNFEVFGAPHLAVVCRDRRLGEYATLDIGVWLGILLSGAELLGLSACAMASVASYPEPLRKVLSIPEDQVILFGVALGYEDASQPANRARTERAPVSANVRFVGF